MDKLKMRHTAFTTKCRSKMDRPIDINKYFSPTENRLKITCLLFAFDPNCDAQFWA